MRRAAAVLLSDVVPDAASPPGVPRHDFVRAMAEDVVDVVASLADVDVAVASTPDRLADAQAIRWPGAALIELAAGEGAIAALQALAGLGYDVGAVVAADAPDIPGLVLAKPFSALSSALVAMSPADGGGLAALAARLPVPDWLAEVGVDLDTADAVERLQVAAPRRRDARAVMPWHRLRAPTDVARLDPGLEGWDATRALLSGTA